MTNHPSAAWGDEQLRAAQCFGEIQDLPFPAVPTDADEAAVEAMAESILKRIDSMQPQAVLVQGEFTLCYRIVTELKARKIPVLAACSTRCVEENVAPDGTAEKRVVFRFERFRHY